MAASIEGAHAFDDSAAAREWRRLEAHHTELAVTVGAIREHLSLSASRP